MQKNRRRTEQRRTEQQKSHLTEVTTSQPLRKISHRGISDDGQPVCYPLRMSRRKSNSKSPIRKANNFRVKSEKRICGRLWKKLFRIRSNGKNTLSGTANGKRPTRYAEKSVCPRKRICKNGAIFARLLSRTNCIRKKRLGRRSAIP